MQPSFGDIVSFRALLGAAKRAAKAAQGSTAANRFMMDIEPNIFALQRALRDGSYQPGPFRSFHIYEPKARRISAAPFVDRVVHHSFSAAMLPLFESHFIDNSYACRKEKGVQAAVLQAQVFCQKAAYWLKLDIRHFFESAKHQVLKDILRSWVEDERVYALAEQVIDHGAPGSPVRRGLPIGNLTSQYFANVYLTPLDHFLETNPRLTGYLRYMDDLVLFGPKSELNAVETQVENFVAGSLDLTLRDDARRLAPVAHGVALLGYRVWPGLIRMDSARKRRLIRKMSAIHQGLAQGSLDPENAGRSLSGMHGFAQLGGGHRILRSVGRRRGWFEVT